MNKIINFSLYRHKSNSDEKDEILHIKELPSECTYFIKVEGDKIEDFLLASNLPERLKQELREDIVNIVRGYNKMIEGKTYSDIMRTMCNNYFKTSLEKYCVKHGILFSYVEYQTEE